MSQFKHKTIKANSHLDNITTFNNNNNANPMKKKITTEKEIIEFLIFLEEKFHYNREKIFEFINAFDFITASLDYDNQDKPGNNQEEEFDDNNNLNELNSMRSGKNNEQYKVKSSKAMSQDTDNQSAYSTYDEKSLESALIRCREILLDSPILLIEFNRFLPKNYKLVSLILLYYYIYIFIYK